MNILRPATEQDIDCIYQLAGEAPAGLTSLPHDRNLIEEKVMESVKNFTFPPHAPNGESFLFVLENHGEVVGTSAIYSKVGGFQPFWTYELKSLSNICDQLNISHEVNYLEVKKEHNGPSEIGTLYLAPEARVKPAGRLLSLARFLFIAQYSEMFEDSILAELRGTIDKRGNAVFWDAIGAHFFGIPYSKADMMVNEDKTFIDDLMPKFPIYIDLLAKEAQLVIGVVAEETRPALRLLEQEGFSKINEVDIFEAGPIVSCETNKIRTIKESSPNVFGGPATLDAPPTHLIANITDLQSFRVIAAPIDHHGDHVRLNPADATALHVKVGDPILISPLNA